MSWRRGSQPNIRQWRKVRVKALDRDGWACVKCGRRAGIEIHHVKSLDDAPEKMYDLQNLASLCKSCHIALHGGRKPDPEVAKWRRYLAHR